MIEITVKVPENKLQFFIELLDQLDLKAVGSNIDIPEWQKEQLDEGIKEYERGTANYTNWNEVKVDLFNKNKVKRLTL
ncbi:MAG: addiction module protein [Crocinitomicaceae bacterium]|nr:addiction module protein [Crocinitomicaceae bacterium]